MSTTTKQLTQAIGEVRVWWITNVPNKAKHFTVFSINEACRLIEAIAQEQLNNPEVGSNICGLQKYVGDTVQWETDKGWDEWEDDDGYGINDYSDNHEDVWRSNP